jgi:phospholipid/cholesterol/gamma-HCH transport system substrate-binding protein
MAQEFSSTPPEFRAALDGVTKISRTLNDRDDKLRDLLTHARESTDVLAKRTDQVVSLIANSNALLAQLRTQSAALDSLSADITALARQLSGFVNDNRTTLRAALDKLNGVLTIVDNRKDKIQESIKLLNPYMMSLGESASSGPFFKPYLANLLPGQFIQPFVDAAFSDLGLDPNVLAPSERTDPQIGQPGTPALPVPYPRTGQGGEPKLNLPDAITGNEDPNLPAQFPGRYPYREPLPAPPPGGPPPGPPAASPPDPGSPNLPTPSPVFVPAPGEQPPSSNGGA